MSEQTTSPTLISRLRHPADREAWSLFEATYRPLIRRYCRRRGIQEHDIDDLTQDVLAQVDSNTWQTFELLWSYKKPVEEVAKELKISIGTVYVNKSRVMKRLEQEILLLSHDLPVSPP
jgi:DNA-directed RNA polymerase specialized sigma24 family protein